MRKLKKIIVVVCCIVFVLPLILIAISFAVGACLYLTADFRQPDINPDLSQYELSVDTDSLKVCRDSRLCLNEYGLWEAYISGNSIERGLKYGALNKDLLRNQEDIFVNQIHEIIPSEWWVKFLHKVIIMFNRDMAKHIPDEYREEIYAMSLFGTDEYESYGTSYFRQLNYHAAHDIGHMMQQYMLVGCSSFACWDDESEDGDLIVGRNFDFYVGDEFAENKVVLFVNPTEGYRFASISWPGMMGVLSGMNETGLTVTINAAKGAIPTSSAMPISLLARHILQYASNIDEAYEIATQFKTFVSESLLIASANDGYAAIIEKTPEKIALYSCQLSAVSYQQSVSRVSVKSQSQQSRLVCTNHYQSEEFENDDYNIENIATSDSPYRHKRLNELLDEKSPIDAEDAVSILRDRYGLGNADIGLSNEKSLNQFIAHHSVVFQPEKLRFWVSTSPWQLGEYVCYELDNSSEFNVLSSEFRVQRSEFNVQSSEFRVQDYDRVCRYRSQYKTITTAIRDNQNITSEFIDEFISNNPNYFQVYNTLGDYELSRGNNEQAILYWNKALSLEIPRTTERDEIIGKIQKYD